MTYCTGFNRECRHCSMEAMRIIRDACDIKTHARVMIRKIIPLGLYCNNHDPSQSGWKIEMGVCYSIWSRVRKGKQKTTK